MKILIVLCITLTTGFTYCNEVDCYEVSEKNLNDFVANCISESNTIMLLTKWKQNNNFKQIILGANGKKQINCLDKIPNKIGYTSNQDFMNELKCSLQNLKLDAINVGIKHYYDCINKFNPNE